MRAECQFAKAGQGLFYNGLIVDQKGRSFSFVYDCGTSSAATVLKNSVSEYKKLLDRRLDLLAISHFHQDHVSEIPELIRGLELRTVVIPFVKPELRLLLAAQYEEIENDDERISLYNDPAMYFLAHGAESVLIAYGDEGDNEDIDFLGEPSNDFPQNDDEDEENPNHIFVLGNKNNNTMNLFESGIDEYSGCFNVIAPSYQWEFRFKNLHSDRLKERFWDDIFKLLEMHNKSFDEILRNKKYIKQLRKIYVDNFQGGLNDTSLILLSRPLQRGCLVDNPSYKRFISKKCIDFDDECLELWLKCSQASTLLLGDLSIDNKVFYRFFQQLESQRSRLPQVIQLPHHGAKMKHHLFYCKPCNDAKHRCNLPITLIASYGIKNGYGHPDLSCYMNCHPGDLFRWNMNIELVNERKDFSYTIAF